jgi:glutaminyl-peptide cyclotransferase
MREVRSFVALGPRVAGTPGAAQAARYLANRLRAAGIEPLVDTFEETTAAGPVTFRNVLGVIEGPGDTSVILLSHYDTKAGIADDFAGANDSGSSTGLLLALAATLQTQAPYPCDIVLAFVDGEECRVRYGPRDGLHGSRHLARTLVNNRRADRVRAVIVADMVGDSNLNLTLPRNSTPRLVSLAFRCARRLGIRDQLSLARGAILDDHVPFIAAGIPAIDLIDFEFGSQPGRNDYWHTTEDTLDKLSAGSLEDVGRLVLCMLGELMASPEP